LVFFFSSGRRHTRFSRDWSSDVCSSDLITSANAPGGSSATQPAARRPSPLIGLSVFERVDVPQEPRVQREAAEAGEGGGQQDVEIGRASCRESVDVGGGRVRKG